MRFNNSYYSPLGSSGIRDTPNTLECIILLHVKSTLWRQFLDEARKMSQLNVRRMWQWRSMSWSKLARKSGQNWRSCPQKVLTQFSNRVDLTSWRGSPGRPFTLFWPSTDHSCRACCSPLVLVVRTGPTSRQLLLYVWHCWQEIETQGWIYLLRYSPW